jgi:hypothetical protein
MYGNRHQPFSWAPARHLPNAPHPRARASVSAVRQTGATPIPEDARPRQDTERVRAIVVIAAMAIHLPVALLMARSETAATFHAVAAIGVGLWIAMSPSQPIARVAYAAAYIAGAEVLWRMTDAEVFWEIGKYATSLILAVGMLRRGRSRLAAIPVTYFLLLLPSVALTLLDADWMEARDLLSGNLSGPFALMVAGCFFSGMTLRRAEIRNLFLAIVAPVVGVAVIALSGIATAEDLAFGSSSSAAASGGFGPNQVSAALGLGSVLCFFLLLDDRVPTKLKAFLAAVMLFLAAQSALTFSRGGLYNALVAVMLASYFLLDDASTRIRFVLAVGVVLVAGYFVVLPRLDAYTGGALSARFEDTSLTNRGEIARLDLEIFLDNPLLGVGPGMAKSHRGELGLESSAHTEFTRLLAEHGVLGAMALILFGAGVVSNLQRARTSRHKAMSAALIAWSFAYMLNAAMRLVAPSFLFGLAFAAWADDTERDRT